MSELQQEEPLGDVPVITGAGWTAWEAALSGYLLLLRMLTEERINVSEFELLFGQLYSDDNTDWPVEALDVLEAIYADLNEFRAPRGVSHGPDQPELQRRAQVALEQLEQLERLNRSGR